MQFQVPQFIEIEDKIFGPLTLKEFIYLAGGAGLSIVIYLTITNKIISIPLIILVVAFSATLTFFRYNGKPFVNVMESAFYYYIGSKLYIWKRTERTPVKKADEAFPQAKTLINVPKLSESKLKDLTWSLDINETTGDNK